MKYRKTITVTLIAAGLVLAGALINYGVRSGGEQAVRRDVGVLTEAQAVLVLGARVYQSGRLSDIFRDRVDTALEVYEAGKAGKILISGDHGRKDYDEVNAAKDYLLARGVPAEDIFMDHAGFDTYDSLYRARDVFAAGSLIVSTQAFHLPRALYIARALGIEAQGIPADKHVYVLARRNAMREALARIKAFFDVQTGAKPKFLGEEIPLSGDGRQSWDSVGSSE